MRGTNGRKEPTSSPTSAMVISTFARCAMASRRKAMFRRPMGRENRTVRASSSLPEAYAASGLQRRVDLVQHLLRIAEQHPVVLLVEERVVHARVTGRHRSLHDDRVLRL